MEVKAQQKKLANNFGKLLRDKFGKGPEAIHVTVSSPFVLFYICGFVSQMEQVLLEQGQDITVKTTREYLMKALTPELCGQIEAITDMDIQHLFYDWNLANQSGIIVGASPPIPDKGPEKNSDYEGKSEVHEEIIRISEQTEKAPDRIESYMLSSRALIVIREGIMVPIEKQLIALGFDEKLRVAKRQLEGEMLSKSNHFSSILDAEVQDVFVDWDFELDKSVISFIIKPKHNM